MQAVRNRCWRTTRCARPIERLPDLHQVDSSILSVAVSNSDGKQVSRFGGFVAAVGGRVRQGVARSWTAVGGWERAWLSLHEAPPRCWICLVMAWRPSHGIWMDLRSRVEQRGRARWFIRDFAGASRWMRMKVRGWSGAFLPGRDRDKGGGWRPLRDPIFACASCPSRFRKMQ